MDGQQTQLEVCELVSRLEREKEEHRKQVSEVSNMTALS